MAERPDNIANEETIALIERRDSTDDRDKVIAALIDESKRAPLSESNYALIQKLTARFAEYIAEHKIGAPLALVNQLRGSDAGLKLAFVKTYLCPQVATLRDLIVNHAAAEKIEIGTNHIDKCVRFLTAMCEVVFLSDK